MRSCLAGLLKPGHKFKTKTTDYSEEVEKNHRTIQKRIWVNIFKAFKFSMSKIEINNFKIHCNALSATLSLNEEFRMLCNICYKRIALKNTCFMFPDVTCISGRYIHIGTIHKVCQNFLLGEEFSICWCLIIHLKGLKNDDMYQQLFFQN